MGKAKQFEYEYIIGFEDTNLLGNVYYVNHIRWQGRCREMFLRTYAPEVLSDMAHGLSIVTLRASCNYFSELAPFDRVSVRMRLSGIVQNRVSLVFDYVRIIGNAEEVIARGEQEIAFMRRTGSHLVATPIPEELQNVLKNYL
jgi:enediyne biosynthesis thioesterase